MNIFMRSFISILRNFGDLSYEDSVDSCQIIRAIIKSIIGIAVLVGLGFVMICAVAIAIIFFGMMLFGYTHNVLFVYLTKELGFVLASATFDFALIIWFIKEKIEAYNYRRRYDNSGNLINKEPSLFNNIMYSIKNKVCIKIDISKYSD